MKQKHQNSFIIAFAIMIVTSLTMLMSACGEVGGIISATQNNSGNFTDSSNLNEQETNFEFVLNGAGYTCVGFSSDATLDGSDCTEVVIPDTYNGLPVTQVGDFDCTAAGFDADVRYFSHCDNLKSVVIGNNVTRILGAFNNCSNLTSVSIPDSVTSCEMSFYDCDAIEYNTYDNAYYLGNENNPYVVLIDAVDTSITSCNVNAKTKLIASNAFNGCSSLTNINLPSGLTSIGGGAFDRCSSLTNLVIPSSVKTICPMFMSDSKNLTSIAVASQNKTYYSVNNCLIERASKTLIFGCKNSVIPEDGSVVSIGTGAFMGCSGLTEITIPNSVVSIEVGAFASCEQLSKVTLPKSLVKIGSFAFWLCDLESIVIPSNVKTIGKGAFVNEEGMLAKVYYGGPTAEEWANIDIGEYNTLVFAPRYYFSENTPTLSGNYWHYDKNGNVVEW